MRAARPRPDDDDPPFGRRLRRQAYQHIVTTLRKLAHPAQVVAICGRNAELLARMQALAATADDGTGVLVPVGYTTAMDEYMSAADVLVGKPGGLTTSEALAKGLLFVIVNPIPGQEERLDHLLEAEPRSAATTFPCSPTSSTACSTTPARDAHARASRLARPGAARDVVRIALGLGTRR
jgi:processive 1,2-diacylglycerol beta-glucosyltransferase